MKNNKGFTLVEIIAVIAILALIVVIAVPVASNTKRNANIKLLETKIDNLRQAAVLYVQDCKELKKIGKCEPNDFQFTIDSCDACKDETGTFISNCFCAGNASGTVTELAIETIRTAGYIEADEKESGAILNPVDKTKELKDCKMILYKKYGKVYAVYKAEGTEDETCWYK